MRQTKFAYLFSLFFLMFSLAGHAQELTPQQEVKQAVSHILSLVEREQYSELMDQFVNAEPGVKEEFMANVAADPQGVKEKMSRFAKALKEAETLEPILSEDNKMATYKLTSDSRLLKFSKINGRWLVND